MGMVQLKLGLGLAADFSRHGMELLVGRGLSSS
jgi:hypothetical protein